MAKDLIFREVSEKERKSIEKQAKKIIDVFSNELSKIKLDEDEPMIERENCERKEDKKNKSNFSRDIMFENALNKNKDFIIAEKKKW